MMTALNKGKSKSQPKKYRRLSTKRMSDKPHITRIKKFKTGDVVDVTIFENKSDLNQC